MLVWGKPGLKSPFRVKIKLSQSFRKEHSSRWLGAEEKSEITAIPNRYKDTLDDLIDSSDTESPDWPDSPDRPGLIDKGSRNVSRSKGNSPTLSEEDRLDEDIPLELVPKIRTSQMHERHDIAPLGLKSGRAQYGSSQRGGEDGKDKKGGENGKDERSY